MIQSSSYKYVPIDMALTAFPLVPLPILSVPWLATSTLKNSPRCAGLSQFGDPCGKLQGIFGKSLAMK
jgi:hypothetical protein